MLRKAFLLIILTIKALAQVPDTPLLENIRVDSTAPHRYRVGGFGIGVSTMRDNLLSPLRYNGITIGSPSSTWTFKDSGWLIMNRNLYSISIDSSSARRGNLITTLNYGFQKHYLKPTNRYDYLKKFYWGGFFEIMGSLRTSIGNVNNVLSYDVGIGIGPSVMFRNRVKVGKSNIDIFNQFSTVLAGIYFRPQYSWSFPAQDSEKNKLYPNFVMGSVNVHRHFDYRLSVDFYQRETKGMFRKRRTMRKVAYRVSYGWQYREFTEPSVFKRGQHLLQFGPIIKI